MDEDELYRKYGHLVRDREFMKSLLRRIWKDAEKIPRLKKALIEAGVPRKLPPEQDHFLTTRPKRKRKQIH